MVKNKTVTGIFKIEKEGITEEEVFDVLKDFIPQHFNNYKFSVVGANRTLTDSVGVK